MQLGPSSLAGNAATAVFQPGGVTLQAQAITGKAALAIVASGVALAPEGWRLFVQ